MRRPIQLALCGAAFASWASAADAGTVIDQEQTTYEANAEVYLSSQIFGNDYRLFQTFVPTYSNSVGAGVYIGLGSVPNDTLRITLYYVPGGIGVGVVVGSGTVTVTQDDTWADVFWSSETPVIAGETYRLEVSSVDTNKVEQIGYARDYYPDGQASGNDLSGGESYDLTFRTFADDGVSGVPEPASWAMMILGFGAIGFAMRRRASRLRPAVAPAA